MSELPARLLTLGQAEAEIPAGHTRAAVALALRGDAREVLLMRRAEREGDRWSGQISLPGGHAEEEDRDLSATAARETREEVGVDLDEHARLLGALAPVRAKARGKPLATTILPAVFQLEAEVTIDLGPEAAAAFWFPLQRAATGALDATHTYEDGDLSIQLPCWTFEGHTIWGLTHGILSTFMTHLR